MQVSSISGRTAFRAQVNGQSPLVSGNWEYISSQPQQVPTATQTEPKKGSFWKKAFWTVATLGVIAGALAWGRGKIPQDVMEKTFKTAEGFKEKALWVLGKGGDYVKAGWNKLVSLLPKVKKAAEEGAEAVTEGVEKATETVAEGVEKMTINAEELSAEAKKAAGL